MRFDNIQIAEEKGFTLVETIIAIVIMGIALSTMAYVLGAGVSDSSDTYSETRTTALAQAYLDEILARRFDERSHPSGSPPCSGLPADMTARPCTEAASFGVDGGESSRALYDDVDDYHGIDEGSGGATLNLLDAEGNIRTGYDNFRVGISVSYVGNQAPISGLLTDAKLITVTVYPPGDANGMDFSVYKANY